MRLQASTVWHAAETLFRDRAARSGRQASMPLSAPKFHLREMPTGRQRWKMGKRDTERMALLIPIHPLRTSSPSRTGKRPAMSTNVCGQVTGNSSWASAKASCVSFADASKLARHLTLGYAVTYMCRRVYAARWSSHHQHGT